MKFPLQYAKILSQKFLNIDDDIIPEIEMCLEREGDKVSIPFNIEDFGITIDGNGYCRYSNVINDGSSCDKHSDNSNNDGKGNGCNNDNSYGTNSCNNDNSYGTNGNGYGYGNGYGHNNGDNGYVNGNSYGNGDGNGEGN